MIRVVTELGYDAFIRVLQTTGVVHPTLINFAIKIQSDEEGIMIYTVYPNRERLVDSSQLQRLRSCRGIINVKQDTKT